MSGKRTNRNQAQVISIIPGVADADRDIIGFLKAELGYAPRPAGAFTPRELCEKLGASRSTLTKVLKEQLAAGALERFKMTERGADGKAKRVTLYRMRGGES